MARLSERQLVDFYDLKRVRLADMQGQPVSWIPLFPEGVFQHPEYGELDFRKPQLDQYLANYKNRVRKIDIAVDIDHKQEQAAGWIKSMEYRVGQQPGLYALVEWNRLGAKLLGDKRYRYISPQFGEYVDEETGDVYPNTLTCATLTNFPFLKKMPAIALSERRRLGRRPTRALTDPRTGLPMVGLERYQRAQRLAEQSGLDWDDPQQRLAAFAL